MYIQVQALFRDSAPHLPRTLKQLLDLTKIDGFSFSFRFYQNDSKDATVELINEWIAQNNLDAQLYSEELNSPKFGSVADNLRVSLLSYYRNKLKTLAGPVDAPLTLLLDTDLIWNNFDFLELVEAIEQLKEAVMVTANTRQNISDKMWGTSSDSFYDVFCLRDSNGESCNYFADSPMNSLEEVNTWKNGQPIRVNSAFGGFALVQSFAYNKVKWSASKSSEHVNFCYELGRFGDIYIVPTSRPKTEIDLSKLNGDAINSIGEQQAKNFSSLNALNHASHNKEYLFNKLFK